MAEGFDAGSIFFALRAEIKGVQQNVDSVKRKLDSFGSNIRSTAETVEVSGAKISNTFNEMDRNTLQQTQKIAAFSQRLLALQTVLSTLGQGASEGFAEFRQEISAGTAGLTTFATVAALVPGKVGLATGAIAGLTLAIVKFVAPSEEAIAALNELTAIMLSNITITTELTRALDRAKRAAEVLGEPFDAAAEKLQLTRARVAQIILELENVEPRLDVLSTKIAQRTEATAAAVAADVDRVKSVVQGLFPALEELERLQGAAGVIAREGADEELTQLKAQQESLNQLKRTLELQLSDIRGVFVEEKLQGAIKAAREEVEAMSDALFVLKTSGQQAVELGIITQMQQTQAEFKAAEAAILRVLQLQQEVRQLGADPDIDLGDFVFEFTRDTKKAELEAKADAKRRGEEFSAAFSEPLTANIGDAVFNGILEGKKAIDILGDVARNVFSTALSQAVNGFQQAMTTVLNSIAGSAGGVIGNILTGIAGVAAAIFLRRRGESTNTFSAVESRIESTQAVRGIVAGPTTIPIASVGQNLDRAFVPVVERLDLMITHLASIDRNVASGPTGGSGSASFQGSVATT